jgi:hypothetical protein
MTNNPLPPFLKGELAAWILSDDPPCRLLRRQNERQGDLYLNEFIFKLVTVMKKAKVSILFYYFYFYFFGNIPGDFC